MKPITPPAPRSGGDILIVAHRGNRVHDPENSLPAFRRAIEDGADLIETDLRPTADGAFVCFHDPGLERRTGVRGEVERCDLGTLKRLRLLGQGGRETGEEIPTLAELAAVLPKDVALALELKSPRFREAGLCRALIGELKKLGLDQRTIVLSFSARRLQTLQKEAPQIPAGHVCLTLFPRKRFELSAPLRQILQLRPGFVREAHGRGALVCPLDPDPDRHIMFYRKLGVDALITDNPAGTIAALRKT